MLALKMPWRLHMGAAVAMLLGLLAAGQVAAATLDPAVLPRIQAATFEVVAAKPVNDPLKYDRPLPLDLLPYQERNDKYYSVGTAFAIGDGRYVTAGHVLQIGIGSLWGEPSLRDAAGHVYAIDKIEKYSKQQDFVVFTLVSPPKVAPLEINTKPTMNDVVYAVGNALGTGVVIRDGLYTSDTPEDQDGRWKWMRFSAAASPGNSGGPLLDKDGKVIGIVLMKSANENLNFALPIDLILKAPDHVASIDNREPYQLDIFDTVDNGTFKAQFDLPKSFADFSATYLKYKDAYADAELKKLLERDPDKLFPRGPGSSRLLHSVSPLRSFPALITRNSSDEWVYAGRAAGKVPLADNGYIMFGLIGHNFLFHMRKPDSLPSAQLYGDPVHFMDLMLKVGFMTRSVGSEKIKITSMGKPIEDSLYTDAWQRHWQVRVWPMPYANSRIITFSLPVPDGYVTMMRFSGASEEHDETIDMRALTGFIDMSYDGTLSQWQDYLKSGSLLPQAFKDIKIGIDYNKRFSYDSKRLSLSFTPELQKIDHDSKLTLGFSYFNDGGHTVWDITDVCVLADADDSNRVNIERHVAPSDDLDDGFKSEWNKLLHKLHPYEGVAYSGDDEMRIATVLGTGGKGTPTALYTAFYGVEGTKPPEAMKSKLDLLTSGLRILEP